MSANITVSSFEFRTRCWCVNIGEGEYLRSVGWICGLHLGLASIGNVTVGLTIPWQGKLEFSFKYAEICKKILGKMNNNCADATFGIVLLEMKLCQIY
ncbi:hypothetical protein OUZ56_028729 [Daphnia magna]|uniref:Uncharacterized protein n=1 Tax=Daphnia magna TaxID=35525 RepID=A0ABR0B4U4_9CRUS|nr:hypothetical protein OUZ56_028729 [Daphnia magna]